MLKKQHNGPLLDSSSQKKSLSQTSNSQSEVNKSKKRKLWERDDQIDPDNDADKLIEKPKKRAVPNFMAKKELEASQKREKRQS